MMLAPALATICDTATPLALISRSIRKAGTPAFLAFCTGATLESEPALSRMMALAPRAMTESTIWFCLLLSSSWLSTIVS